MGLGCCRFSSHSSSRFSMNGRLRGGKRSSFIASGEDERKRENAKRGKRTYRTATKKKKAEAKAMTKQLETSQQGMYLPQLAHTTFFFTAQCPCMLLRHCSHTIFLLIYAFWCNGVAMHGRFDCLWHQSREGRMAHCLLARSRFLRETIPSITHAPLPTAPHHNI